jgi:4-hydroxy-tetrahydrodipicolinate synthase
MPDSAIEGVFPVIATPFGEDGEVDYDALREEVVAIADQGCHGAVLFGVVTEFFKLTDDERDRMVEVVTDAVTDRDLTLVISVTHEATGAAVKWAREYEEAGADGLMVYTPTERNPSGQGIYDHLTAIGEAVSTPVMVQHTDENVAVNPATYARLADEIDTIQYFKIEVTPPGPYVDALMDAVESDVDILVGSGGVQMIEIFDRGGVGVIPAAMYNEVYIEIYDRYFEGDREGAIDLHSRLLPTLNQTHQAPIQYEKAALSERGLIPTDYCRKPLPVSRDEVYDDLFESYHERAMALVEAVRADRKRSNRNAVDETNM